MAALHDNVSSRVLGLHRDVAEALGISLATALEGTGIDPRAAAPSGEVRWSQYVRSLERLEELAGSRERLLELARRMNTPSSFLPYGAVFSRIVDVRLIAYVALRWAAPSLFPCIRMRFAWRGARSFQAEIEIPPRLEGSRLFLEICGATTFTLPRFVGLPDAEGELRYDGDRYLSAHIQLPGSTKERGALKNALRFLFSGQQLVEELVKQNEELRAQQQALEEARSEAEEQRSEAERASRLKSTFVAAVSHEMRTPMNALTLAARLLERSQLDATQREQVDVLGRTAMHMTRVLDDLMDLDGMEANRLLLEERPFELQSLVEELRRMLTPTAAERGLSLHVDVDVDVPVVVAGDAARVRQVLLNLVANGLRYTKAGHVRVHVTTCEGGGIQFEVCDTGPGLLDEERDRVFEPFVQGRARATPRGAGLGLTIARHLVERMGGSIGVESQVDAGSRFWFRLPLPASVDARAVASPPSSSGAEKAAGLRVLLVEDDDLTSKVSVMLLASFGCVVTTASDGQEAVTACARQRFDVVLMDCRMPVLGGLEATRMIRAGDGPNRRTPIIGLTAGSEDGEQVRWSAAGMSHLLRKPLNVEALEAVLEEVASRAGLPVEAAGLH